MIADFLEIPIGELYNNRLQDEKKPGVTYSIEYREYRQMVMEQAEYYRNVIDEERNRRKEVEEKVNELERKRDELLLRLEELSEIRILLKQFISEAEIQRNLRGKK